MALAGKQRSSNHATSVWDSENSDPDSGQILQPQGLVNWRYRRESKILQDDFMSKTKDTISLASFLIQKKNQQKPALVSLSV